MYKYAVILAILWCYSTPIYAAERLRETLGLSSAEAVRVDLYLEQENLPPRTDFKIAQNDLNQDGIQELILHSTTCKTHQRCTYLILAEIREKIIKIGQIEARKLLLAGDFTHGVQDFLAFQSDTNDYEYERYVWSPLEAAYVRDIPE